jgi:hypothetical protein
MKQRRRLMLRMKNLDEMVRELDLRRRHTPHDETMDEGLRKAAESTKSDIDRAFKKLKYRLMAPVDLDRA